MTVIRHEDEMELKASQRKGRGRRAPRAWFENLLRGIYPMSPKYWLAEQFKNNDTLTNYAMSTPGFLRDLQSWFMQNKDMLAQAPGSGSGGFQDLLFQQFPALKNEYVQGLGKVFQLDASGNPVAVRPSNYDPGRLPEGHTLGFPEVPGWQPQYPPMPMPRPEIPNPTPWGSMVPGPMPPFPRYGRPGLPGRRMKRRMNIGQLISRNPRFGRYV